MTRELSGLRREYLQGTLSESDLDADPIRQFDAWFTVAVDSGMELPNAMSLATCGVDGVPAVRTVLLKDFSADGFVFYTHGDSPKGEQLAANPRAALLFFWSDLGRQVRIEGPAALVSDREADEYFRSRPYASQLGAWVAPQSSVINGREVIDRNMEQLAGRYPEGTVPRPPDWVGYRVSPDTMEFWQGRESRLHDRFRYRRAADGGWEMQRLAP